MDSDGPEGGFSRRPHGPFEGRILAGSPGMPKTFVVWLHYGKAVVNCDGRSFCARCDVPDASSVSPGCPPRRGTALCPTGPIELALWATEPIRVGPAAFRDCGATVSYQGRRDMCGPGARPFRIRRAPPSHDDDQRTSGCIVTEVTPVPVVAFVCSPHPIRDKSNAENGHRTYKGNRSGSCDDRPPMSRYGYF